MVNAAERLPAAVDETRHGARAMVSDDTQIDAMGIHGPSVDVRQPVAFRKTHRILDPRIVPHLDRGIRPPIVAVAHRITVDEGHVLLEHSPVGLQDELHDPLHAVDTVDVAHDHHGAAIRPEPVGKIHRRNRHIIVAHRKVELEPERRPGAAVADESLLDRPVVVKYRAAADLIDT